MSFDNIVTADLLVTVNRQINIVAGNRFLCNVLGTHLSAVIDQNGCDTVRTGQIRFTGLLNTCLADNACVAVTGACAGLLEYREFFGIDSSDITDNVRKVFRIQINTAPRLRDFKSRNGRCVLIENDTCFVADIADNTKRRITRIHRKELITVRHDFERIFFGINLGYLEHSGRIVTVAHEIEHIFRRRGIVFFLQIIDALQTERVLFETVQA